MLTDGKSMSRHSPIEGKLKWLRRSVRRRSDRKTASLRGGGTATLRFRRLISRGFGPPTSWIDATASNTSPFRHFQLRIHGLYRIVHRNTRQKDGRIRRQIRMYGHPKTRMESTWGRSWIRNRWSSCWSAKRTNIPRIVVMNQGRWCSYFVRVRRDTPWKPVFLSGTVPCNPTYLPTYLLYLWQGKLLCQGK
jgi:hypothetical protein